LTLSYLSYPEGEVESVDSHFLVGGNYKILAAPSTSELLAIFGTEWPTNLKFIGFGDISIDSLDSVLEGIDRRTIGLLTSGTTSKPKLVLKELASFAVSGRPDQIQEHTWGHFYDNSRIASQNVVCHVLQSGGRLAERPNGASYKEILEFYSRVNVSAIAATPSLVRYLMASDTFRHLELQQISLGGEIADDFLLGNLRATFPEARITHVYATTETGSLFSVSDGMAGFPLSYLGKPLAGNRSLFVRDNLLVVKDLESDAEFETGDIVRIDNQASRVLFEGRKGDFINVGGRKVSPVKVRNAALTHPLVSGCQVFAVPNKFLGEVVGVQISSPAGEQIQTEVNKLLNSMLEKWERPVLVEWSQEVPLGANGKSAPRRRVDS
jgi:acyl-coenzyme A synthetase/AMP-(fatty) acid ligase